MTLELIRTEIWQNLAEPSDLDPATDTQYQAGPLLNWVANEGQRRISMWRDPTNNRPIRMRNLTGDMYFMSKVIEGTLDADGTSTSVVFPGADVNVQEGRYRGWIVEVESERKVVVDYEGAALRATVHSEWDSTPASGDAYKLYKRHYYLMNTGESWVDDHIQLPTAQGGARGEGNLITPLKIVDITEQRTLTKSDRVESNLSQLFSPGDPAEWYLYGKRVIMDRPLDEEKWFWMEYYRLPKDMVADADEPEIPDIWQYGIVLWSIWWGHRRAGDNALAYSIKRDFVDFMRSTRSSYEVERDREDSHGSLEMEAT